MPIILCALTRFGGEMLTTAQGQISRTWEFEEELHLLVTDPNTDHVRYIIIHHGLHIKRKALAEL